MSRRELSAATGISRTVLIGYETGRTVPGAREIRLLCNALKVTPNKILFGVEEPFKGRPDALLALGLTDEDSAMVPIMLLFRMLALEERSAVLTLMRAVIEGRMGKEKFEQAQKALTVAGQLVPGILEHTKFRDGMSIDEAARALVADRFREAGLPLGGPSGQAERTPKPQNPRARAKQRRK